MLTEATGSACAFVVLASLHCGAGDGSTNSFRDSEHKMGPEIFPGNYRFGLVWFVLMYYSMYSCSLGMSWIWTHRDRVPKWSKQRCLLECRFLYFTTTITVRNHLSRGSVKIRCQNWSPPRCGKCWRPARCCLVAVVIFGATAIQAALSAGDGWLCCNVSEAFADFVLRYQNFDPYAILEVGGTSSSSQIKKLGCNFFGFNGV